MSDNPDKCVCCGGEIVFGTAITRESYRRSMFYPERGVEHTIETFCQACADAERAEMWDQEDGPCPYQTHIPGRA